MSQYDASMKRYVEFAAVDIQAIDPQLYMDIRDMPATISQITFFFSIVNNTGQTLYFKVSGVGSPTGWTWASPKLLGSLANGARARYFWPGNSRTKPASELLGETVSLKIEGYTDSGYTIKVGEKNVSYTFDWIDSGDGTWTTDVLNNFDDGTVQGWAGSAGTTVAASTKKYLSPNYSLQHATLTGNRYIYRTITVGSGSKAYAIINFLTDHTAIKFRHVYLVAYAKYYYAQDDSLGYTLTITLINIWYRAVVPLTPNTTTEIQIGDVTSGASPNFYLDDFKVIRK